MKLLLKLHCVICEGCFWRAAARASLRRPSHVTSDVCSNLLSGCSLHWGLLMGKGFEMSKRLKKTHQKNVFMLYHSFYCCHYSLCNGNCSFKHTWQTLSPFTPNPSFSVNGFKNKTDVDLVVARLLLLNKEFCCYLYPKNIPDTWVKHWFFGLSFIIGKEHLHVTFGVFLLSIIYLITAVWKT